MRKPFAILPLVVVLAVSICVGLRAQDAAVLERRAGSATAEKLLSEIERILKNTRITTYEHKTKVDEGKGEYHLDCSGLLCYALKRIAPEHLKAVPKEKGHARQLAEDFQTAFETAPTDPAKATRWLRIERLADAKPGDVIAWRRDPPPPPGESTGHVVILVEVPVKEKDGQFRVVVIDSTSGRHAEDTRGENENGVGRGTMWLTGDEQGRPTGYRSSRRDGKLNIKPIAVGRAMGTE